MTKIVQALVSSLLVGILFFFVLAFVYASFDVSIYEIHARGIAAVLWGLFTIIHSLYLRYGDCH